VFVAHENKIMNAGYIELSKRVLIQKENLCLLKILYKTVQSNNPYVALIYLAGIELENSGVFLNSRERKKTKINSSE